MATRIRLLSRSSDGQYIFTTFARDCMPSNGYAILSHTWGHDEVLYDDICNDAARKKDGWKKVQFCADQAQADNLQYFWLDTCCIDKSSSAELSEGK